MFKRGLILGFVTTISAAASAFAQSPDISVEGPSGVPFALSANVVDAMPSLHLEISFKTEHGPVHAAFDGPLLWAVLSAAHAADPAKPRDAVREVVILTGSDGYVALLALGEISPAFGNKGVILADRMNGKPLGEGHFRIVIPGDVHGGRDVRDVRSITIRSIAP